MSGRPKRSLGQNFLVDPNTQRRIVDAADLDPGDDVLEIGPGRGALTRHLRAAGVRLTAVELDDELAAALAEEADEDFRLVHGDVLQVDLRGLFQDWGRVRVLGNIPYNITTPILFRLLEAPPPAQILLLVQAEVANRVVADPGTKAYGALSVGVRSVARAERLFTVPASVFRPRPRVESALLRVTPHPSSLTEAEASRLRAITRAAFGWRRKKLVTTLSRTPGLALEREAVRAALEELGHPESVRPERLSPEDFISLARLHPSR